MVSLLLIGGKIVTVLPSLSKLGEFPLCPLAFLVRLQLNYVITMLLGPLLQTVFFKHQNSKILCLFGSWHKLLLCGFSPAQIPSPRETFSALISTFMLLM